MQIQEVKQHKDINNVNAESIISIELYIVVSIYSIIEYTKYRQKCETKSDMKIGTKIRDKDLKGSEIKYSICKI